MVPLAPDLKKGLQIQFRLLSQDYVREKTILKGQRGSNTLFAGGSSETVVSGVVLEVNEEVGGGEEKLNVGKVKLLGREAGGRSGSSAT